MQRHRRPGFGFGPQRLELTTSQRVAQAEREVPLFGLKELTREPHKMSQLYSVGPTMRVGDASAPCFEAHCIVYRALGFEIGCLFLLSFVPTIGMCGCGSRDCRHCKILDTRQCTKSLHHARPRGTGVILPRTHADCAGVGMGSGPLCTQNCQASNLTDLQSFTPSSIYRIAQHCAAPTPGRLLRLDALPNP